MTKLGGRDTAWPGGEILDATIADPAVGVNFSEFVVPVGFVYLCQSLKFRMAASANAAARHILVSFRVDGVNVALSVNDKNAHVANETADYHMGLGVGGDPAGFILNTVAATRLGILPRVYLPGGSKIRVEELNIDAADQFSLWRATFIAWRIP